MRRFLEINTLIGSFWFCIFIDSIACWICTHALMKSPCAISTGTTQGEPLYDWRPILSETFLCLFQWRISTMISNDNGSNRDTLFIPTSEQPTMLIADTCQRATLCFNIVILSSASSSLPPWASNQHHHHHQHQQPLEKSAKEIPIVFISLLMIHLPVIIIRVWCLSCCHTVFVCKVMMSWAGAFLNFCIIIHGLDRK